MIEKYKDAIVIDSSTKTAYLSKELRTSQDFYAIMTHLKNVGISSLRFVDYNELVDLKGKFSSVIQEQTEIVQSDVLKEFAGIIREAVKSKVSDVHIRTDSVKGEVLFRQDGLLTSVKTYSKDFTHAMMRAFYQNLSVAESNYVETEHQVAQFKKEDIQIDIPDEILSIRVQRGPKLSGQFMVLRLLYKETKELDVNIDKEENRMMLGIKMLTNYGYLPEQALSIVSAARGSSGIGIVAGPTGSGKSTALKIILEFQHIIYPWKAIYTIEDPPEYPIKGAVQLPVLGTERGNKFAEALKVCMRADPDIIMVGEIRDQETADLSINASLTGHQVWSTVHAIDTFAVFSRFEGLGIPMEKLIETDVIKLIIAQRLVPILCNHCKVSVFKMRGKVDPDVYKLIAPYENKVFVKNPSGCEKCNGKGIAGRRVVAEVLPVDTKLLTSIKEKGIARVRNEWKDDNFTMVRHGLIYVLQGMIDPSDLIANVDAFSSKDIQWVVNSGKQITV